MKVFIPIALIFLGGINCSYSQITDIHFGSGILYSDFTTWDPTMKEGNTWKRGFYSSIGVNQKVWKFIHFNYNLNYFQRKPLEIFVFVSKPDLGIGGGYIFSKVPTSRQSNMFDPMRFNLLNDFKHFGVSFLPQIRFGKRLQFEAGIGLFYNRLLNYEETIVKEEDLPDFAVFFEPPFFVEGQVSYSKNDFGWVSNITLSYAISSSLSLQSDFKSYHSFTKIHEFMPPSIGNPRWLLFSGGLILNYTFSRKN